MDPVAAEIFVEAVIFGVLLGGLLTLFRGRS